MRNTWLRKKIRDFTPYEVAPIQEKYVINANESPYNLFSVPAVKAAFLQELDTFTTQTYPDPMANELRQALGEYVNVQPEQILCGNGGDEIISYILHTFLDDGDTVLVHSPTFDMYELGAIQLGAKVVKVSDLVDYKHDIQQFLNKINNLQPKLTFFCNPNNPTGELLPLSVVEQVAAVADNPVVIDEAYLEFSDQESAISLLNRYDNIIVVRTLSKAFGLAGLRLGYCVSTPDMIKAVAKVKAPYNLNKMTQLIGCIALAHRAEILKNLPLIKQNRADLIAALNELPEVKVYDSATNFFLVKVPDNDGLFQALKNADILVKNYSQKNGLEDCLRISVTTKEVTHKVLAVFREVIQNA